MPAQDMTRLTRTARDLAEHQMTGLFRDPVRLVPKSAAQRWDETLLRQVQTDLMGVWRVFGHIAVETDAKGRVTRFEDGTRLAVPPGPVAVPLGHAEYRSIGETTGLVSPHARIIAVALRENGFAEVTVNQFVPGYPVTLVMVVDPARQIVAALDVRDWGLK